MRIKIYTVFKQIDKFKVTTQVKEDYEKGNKKKQ